MESKPEAFSEIFDIELQYHIDNQKLLPKSLPSLTQRNKFLMVCKNLDTSKLAIFQQHIFSVKPRVHGSRCWMWSQMLVQDSDQVADFLSLGIVDFLATSIPNSWFKREQIMKTRTREQTWSLDQFKWHFCNSDTTGPPPAPTGPPPAPTAGPPPDHRRCTTCTHRHIGPLMHHRRTTVVPPPDHHSV
ncbi:hypothetical protein LXL04_015447 [Taraxacum kok-saghyz]